MFWLALLLYSGQSGPFAEKYILHEDLYEPRFLRLDQEDRVYTNNSEENILVFDKDGTFIRKFGREGQGPGEFTRIRDLGILSDGRMLVSDGGAGKVLILDKAGGLLEVLPMKMSSVGSILVLPDDSFVVATSGLGRFSLNSDSEPEPRYIHFDLNGKKLGGYGAKTIHENPMAAVFANRGYLVRIGKEFVHAGIPVNELAVYGRERETNGHYAVPFVPLEMEVKTEESVGSDGNKRYTMRIKADRLCNGLAVEQGKNLLMLRAVSSTEDRDPDEPQRYNLVRLNLEGKALKVWEGVWEARHLAIDRAGKHVFFVNELEEDTAISRLTL